MGLQLGLPRSLYSTFIRASRLTLAAANSFIQLGGATAKFGDPTGRLGPRAQEHRSVRVANMAAMHMQLKRISASIEDYGRRYGYTKEWVWRRALTNNNVWWNKTPFVEVLRDLGMYMRLGPMLGRDTYVTAFRDYLVHSKQEYLLYS